MSSNWPTPFIVCDCDCKECEPGTCGFSPTEDQHDGESHYAIDDGWYNVDPAPDDGEGEHYCPPCGQRRGISEEFLA